MKKSTAKHLVDEACDKFFTGVKAPALAAEYGVHETSVYNWVRQRRAEMEAQEPLRPGEEFRGVPGWPEYEVSNFGRLRRAAAKKGTRAGKLLKPTVDRKGYHRIRLYSDDRQQGFLVHRLVALAFIDPNGVGEVCHGDGNPSNNWFKNLRFDTHQANMDDAVAMGRMRRGERHGMNRFTEAQIRAAKDRMASGESFAEVARSLGSGESHVRAIANGRIWGWL